jgi:hypothetical protein
MTAEEYATLMDFLATRFARIDARLDVIEARLDGLDGRQTAVETRLARSEVLWESVRDEIRRVAEGVIAVNERLDRFQAETRERFDRVERDIGGLQVRFDRFAVDFGTVRLDYEARIEALERHRRSRGPGG